MTRQWIGTGIFLICIVAAPFLANALWKQERPRALGYAVGFALILVGALTMRLLGGFPNALR